jgi:hypothetical protein
MGALPKNDTHCAQYRVLLSQINPYRTAIEFILCSKSTLASLCSVGVHVWLHYSWVFIHNTLNRLREKEKDSKLILLLIQMLRKRIDRLSISFSVYLIE